MPERRDQLLAATLAWIGVLVPLGWGVWMTVKKALLLFR